MNKKQKLLVALAVVLVLLAVDFVAIYKNIIAAETKNVGNPKKQEYITGKIDMESVDNGTSYNPDSENNYTSVFSTAYGNNNPTIKDSGNKGDKTANSTSAQKNNAGTTKAVTPNNYQTLSWSKQEILDKLSSSINKTKGYKGSLSVHHTESFTSNVTKCTGGEIIKTVANLLVGMVVKPVDETLSYNNGSAVNSEGKTVQLLLPKDGSFSLPAQGVQSATISQNNQGYKITVKLVKESVGTYDVPQYNSKAVGYLNVKELDISFFNVTSAQITYKGSSITAYINDDGYVYKAIYSIPLYVDGAGEKGSMKGEVSFDGEQKETWELPFK